MLTAEYASGACRGKLLQTHRRPVAPPGLVGCEWAPANPPCPGARCCLDGLISPSGNGQARTTHHSTCCSTWWCGRLRFRRNRFDMNLRADAGGAAWG
jgi:hypothetical protein